MDAVTGGAGFIGSHLVEKLLSEGREVAIVDNFHSGCSNNVNRKAKLIVANSGELRGEFETIFHLGIYSSSPMYRGNRLLVSKAMEDFLKLMELATKTDAKVVFASTSSLYNGNPIPFRESMKIIPTDFYTEARYWMERIAEVYHKLYGTKVVALRLFSVYGDREECKGKYANLVSQFIWKMLKGESPVIYGNGSQTRDFIHVEDVAEAFKILSKSDFGVYNVGTGKNYSLNQLVSMINSALGTEIKPVYVKNPIKNYVMDTLASTKKAEKLGFKTKISLKEGIERVISYYNKI